MQNEFYLHENKKSHSFYGFALSLALKQRLGQLENGLMSRVSILSSFEIRLFSLSLFFKHSYLEG